MCHGHSNPGGRPAIGFVAGKKKKRIIIIIKSHKTHYVIMLDHMANLTSDLDH